MISLKPIPALGLHLYSQAAEDIGTNLGWSAAQKTSLLLKMAGAIRAGKLCVRDSSTGTPLTVTPNIDSPSLVYVSEDDVNTWLQQQGAIYRWSPSLPAAAAQKFGTRPLQQQQFQENEILRVINELGYTASALPKTLPGKPGVKKKVREKLKLSIRVFDKAWERLRADKRIADSDK
jgi:hypothetical protein